MTFFAIKKLSQVQLLTEVLLTDKSGNLLSIS